MSVKAYASISHNLKSLAMKFQITDPNVVPTYSRVVSVSRAVSAGFRSRVWRVRTEFRVLRSTLIHFSKPAFDYALQNVRRSWRRRESTLILEVQKKDKTVSILFSNPLQSGSTNSGLVPSRVRVVDCGSRVWCKETMAVD